MNKDESKDGFCKACSELARSATEQVLAQLSAEQLQAVGRAVVHQWVCGNIMKEAGKIADSLPAMLMGEADVSNAKELLMEAKFERLELRLDMGTLIDAVRKVKAAKEAEAQAEAKTEGQSMPDAAFQPEEGDPEPPAPPEEDAMEEVPTEAAQPMFSAEDVCEGSAEGEAVTPETEGGAL